MNYLGFVFHSVVHFKGVLFHTTYHILVVHSHKTLKILEPPVDEVILFLSAVSHKFISTDVYVNSGCPN